MARPEHEQTKKYQQLQVKKNSSRKLTVEGTSGQASHCMT